MTTTTLRAGRLLVTLTIVLGLAGTSPAAAAGDAAPPCDVPMSGCAGVRPGSLLMPMGCTAGFLFRAGGDRYVSTAGHCAGLYGPDDGLLFPQARERVWARGDGAPVYDRDGSRIGEFAYAIHTREDPDPGPLPRDADLALIRLDRGVDWSPQMCVFGGPTAIDLDRRPVTEPVQLHYFGNTPAGGYDYVRGEWISPARTGVANGTPDGHRVMVLGHASFGDSGAPVTTTDGRAVGLLSGPPDGVPLDGHAGAFVVTRLSPQISRAEVVLGRKLRLLTADTSDGAPLAVPGEERRAGGASVVRPR